MTRAISRRAFVRGTLGTVTAGALLGSCRATGPDRQAPPATTGSQNAPKASIAHDWEALDGAIEGRVIRPAAADYGEAKSLFNTRFDNSTPAAVVSVKSTDDVRHTVEFAARNGIQIAVRSGGHSYIGASAADSTMVIDVRQLPADIGYDGETVTVPAAAQLDSVQTALAARGRSIPSGSSPSAASPV
jgi:FAD/FMN-containing dehydrogenase